MRVTILDDYFDTLRTLPSFATLAGHEVTVLTEHVPDPAALAERLTGAEALVLFRERTPITAELLDRLADLRLISQWGPYPHIDVDAAARTGVTVCSDLTGGGPSHATAELTWALVLAWHRSLPAQAASLRAGHWQSGVGSSLRGRTLGIYSYGRIGQAVAGYGRAFGMDVVVHGRPSTLDRAVADGLRAEPDRAGFFAAADVLSLHLRMLPATRGIVTATDLARMKPTALLVNTSRAALVEPGALLAALRAGRPGGAAVDVFDTEPTSADPLLELPQVLATPHIGFVTHEELDRQFAPVFAQVAGYARGAPINVVAGP